MPKSDGHHRHQPKVRSPLAIVGMACRLPGGVFDVKSFWELLASGRSGITEVPANRWNRERYYHADTAVPNRMHSKWGGFIEPLHGFDARFWGISPREAARMDPQQRWLMEVAWEAIEDAGIPPRKIAGTRTGVYIGIASSDYAQIQMTNHEGLDVHSNSGNTLSIASNRISYALDLKGPSLSVDTACSSSLVAVSLACQSIWDGTCDAVLVGGSNAIIVPSTTMAFSKATMLSPDGKCFTFDSRANGYVRGEGAGVILIKPLPQAVEDGDPIYAVIRAAVTNQDGKTSAMTVPGVDAQRAMLETAYAEAGLPPHCVAYMEAHGTGTPLGDPIEATALGDILSRGRNGHPHCLVGSVKTNIGHLEAGSGIAGLIKAALVLKYKQVPPNLNFSTPNPNIPLEQLRLEVPTTLRPLPSTNGDRPVTAVNSFGFGGTNAHVVLEAAPDATVAASTSRPVARADRPCVLPISARDDDALRNNVKAHVRLLRDDSLSLADLCYSAGARREQHPQRLTVIGRDPEDLRERLGLWLGNPEASDGVVYGNTAKETGPLTFVYTGQGPQWWGMGHQLMQQEPIVRQTLERIDTELSRLANWSLVEEMSRDQATSRINETHIAQPSIFALQVALTELWKSWGIVPDRVIGHSVGEVAAAYAAGIYSLGDATRLVFHRSRLQDSTRGKGRMLAAGIRAAEARQMIGDLQERVTISAINSPNLITFAGDTEVLAQIARQLEEQNKFFKWLGIDYAFHSHHMDPIHDELLESLHDLQPLPGEIPFISTVTGDMLLGEQLDASYWWRNVRLPVLFAPAISALIRRGGFSFLELGPHPSMRSSIEDCLAENNQRGAVFHSLRRERDEALEMLQNLGGLYAWGFSVDWAAVNQSDGTLVRLPAYQWSHEDFWLEAADSERERLADTVHPLLGLPVDSVQPTWEFMLDPRLFPYVNDHKLWDSIVFPAAGFGEIGLALAQELFPDEAHAVEGIEIRQALFAWTDKITKVRVVFDPTDKSFGIYSSVSGRQDWELHAEGRLTPLLTRSSGPVDLSALRSKLPQYVDHEQYYADLIAAGYGFGPNFRHVQRVWRTPGAALAEIEVPTELHSTVADYYFHPAVLDACFQVFRAVREMTAAETSQFLFLPASIGRIRLHVDKPPTHLWAHATLRSSDAQSMICDIHVYDDQGQPVADIQEFRVEPVERKQGGDELESWLYQFHWEMCRLRGTGIQGSCHFSGTADMVAAADCRMPELYQRYGIGDYSREFLPRSERITCQFIQNAFLKLGWDVSVGDTFHFPDFVRELGIVRQHYRVARIQLKSLEAAGMLRSVGPDSWTVLEQPVMRSTAADLDQLKADYPRLAHTEIALSQMNGEAADRILTGEVNATELLFPGGSSKMVGQFYVDGLDFPVQNRLIAAAVAKAVENLPPRRALRVLEIGAGTGSLTREVLPVLPPDRTEYLFTDIGPAFVTSAKAQFGNYPFIDYKPFDLEKPASEQGLNPHGYDLILASAVLHATEDLRRTLRNIVDCLAPDGLLVFLEPIHRRNLTDIIFGGLPGWWMFTDTDLRPDHALMERSKWEWLLSDCGFRDVTSAMSAPTEAESEQAILIAVAPELSVEKHVDPSRNGSRASTSVAEGEPQSEPTTHLVFADRQGLADGLVAQIEQHGARAVCVTVGHELQQTAKHAYELSPSSADELRELLQGLGPIATITHCWSLDHPQVEDVSSAALEQTQTTGVLHALRLAQVLSDLEWESPPRVFLLTRGVQRVVGADAVPGLPSAPLIGFGRVANSEHAPFRWTAIDLDAEASQYEPLDLVNELLIGDKELEIAYRDGRRYANRLRRTNVQDLVVRKQPAMDRDGTLTPYRLQIGKPGVLTNLTLNETPRPAPGPDQIEVQVAAGGINFRDVMKALGMYPGNPVDVKWFGDDFAGVITQVGDGVQRLREGDRVAGIAPYCFRSYAQTRWQYVFKVPDGMPLEGAATLPTVFLTAQYAIRVLARMQEGERILIHAAAGGVGQAAIQIAQDIGLEVFATAGSPEKRQLLADLGVRHIMNSRSLDFADEIMEITGGRGVDAVLNSLAGPFVPKSYAVLAPFGRFLEIGKVDVYNNSKIGMAALKHNISYFVIDLAECLERQPQLITSLFAELADKFASGVYRPLSHKVFPIDEVVDAFRYMAQGQHVGKNVLSFDATELSIGPCTQDGHLFRADGSYLISGGAGGFGLEVARWLAKHGARHVVLMSRSGPRDDADIAAIEQLRADGIHVVDARGDVTNPADVQRIVQDIRKKHPPLRGVIHGAMVLDDGFIVDLDDERFQNVMRPKMVGAWNLHTTTLDDPLEHFISFSSFSSVAGGAKQSNYNAGNFFLDSLSCHRRALGLPALTLNWGGISGAGFVHRNQKISEYFERIGFQSISVEDALRVLQMMLQYDPGQMAVARVDWKNMERFSPFVAMSSMFLPLTRESAVEGAGASKRPLIMAAPAEEKPGLVRTLLAEHLAAVCGIDVSKVDPNTSIIRLGLDSLMAIELINRVENELGLILPMGKVISGPTLGELADTVVQLLAYSADEGGVHDGASGGDRGALSRSDKLVQGGTEAPLSETQLAHWFQYQLDADHCDQMAFVAEIRPVPDEAQLREAWRLLLNRYPMLTARFSDRSGAPSQYHQPAAAVAIPRHDATNWSEDRLRQELTQQVNRTLPITDSGGIRLELFKRQGNAAVILLAAHRLVMDAWSFTTLVNELLEICDQLASEQTPKLAEPGSSYAGFVAWERDYFASDAAQKDLNFWKEYLAGSPKTLRLPITGTYPTEPSLAGQSFGFSLDEALVQQLLTMSAEQDVSLSATLLSAFQLILHRTCHQADLLVACEVSGRQTEELERIFGRLSRFVPLRSNIVEQPTFLDILQRNKQDWEQAEQHCRCSMGKLLAELTPSRDDGQSPLCQAAFQMQRQRQIDPDGVAVLMAGQAGHRLRHGRFTLEGVGVEWHSAPVELALRVEEAGGRIYGSWVYRNELFSPGVIEEMHNGLVEMLQEIVRHPFVTPDDLRIVLRQEATADDVSGEWRPDAAGNGELIRFDGPERATPATPFVAPRSETEQLVARVWEEMLDIRPIGLREEFSASGGHSLSLTLMCAKLHSHFLRRFVTANDPAGFDRRGFVGLDRCTAGCQFAARVGSDRAGV